MSQLTFSMVGEPRGKGRPRVFVQGGRSVATTDPQTRRYEASVSELARKAMMGRAPLEGPLSVSIRFRMPIPKSATKRARSAMAAGEVAPTSRPDLGIASKSGVHRLVHALRQRGAIEFQDHAKRSISVVTDPGAMELLDARTSDHLRAIRDRCDLILRARAQ